MARGGRMRGGYGGEGYGNYGRDYGRGSQGGGAEGPTFGDYGSLPSGAERRYLIPDGDGEGGSPPRR